MPNPFEFADYVPEEPSAPFGNPTEEPGFSPDYTEILPELAVPGSLLPLFPSFPERASIRRFCSFVCISLMFTLLTVLSVQTLLTMLVQVILRQIDLRALGELPLSYSRIAEQYISGSAILPAISLLSGMAGTFAGAFVCAKLTGIRVSSCFSGTEDPARQLHTPRLLLYILLALCIQLAGVYLGDLFLPVLKNTGLPIHAVRTLCAPTLQTEGSAMRVFLQALNLILVIPAAEELLYRGLILKNACRVSQRTGIFFSALLFAVMQTQLLNVLPAFVLGLLLAYLTLHHGTVLPAMLVRAGIGVTAVCSGLLRAYLSAGTYSTIARLSALSLLAAGFLCFCFFAATERMPMQTPHQSTRAFRLLLSTPLFPVLLAAVVFMAWLRML